jgi:signal transduction histidine kinase/CheY-like chemotaxis protein
MADSPTAPPDDRVLILAPTGRDAALSCEVLLRAGIDCTAVGSVEELCREVDRGVGAALVAEEALTIDPLRRLFALLERQPPWSDVPFILITREGDDLDPGLEPLGKLANVMVVERPTRIGPLVSIVRTALRARRRQYEVRDLLRQLADLDRRKDEFIAMLGHELRNPLAAISMAADLMARSRDEKVARRVQVIQRQTRNLSQMVDDLLEVSRVLSGKINLRPQRIDLNLLARNVEATVRGAGEARSQTLIVQTSRAPVVVDADPVRVEQVLVNLLHNAIKYTPNGGHIALEVASEGGAAVIRVRDDGIGIAPHQLGSIFEPFSQVETSLDRAQGGLGLGLPVVKSLVALHGGEVSATSDGQGRGSVFTVRLPLRSGGADADAPGAEEEEEAPTPPERARLLLVDDNADILEMLRDVLEGLGHDVDVAADGCGGVDKALANPPDVAFVDIGLPGLDGYEVARRIRAAHPASHVRLVAMTGYGQPEDRDRALRAGFDHHLVKPIDRDDILGVLAKLMPAAE